jgi:hypothetical protein
MRALLIGAAALSLAACADGKLGLSPEACATAQKALALAEVGAAQFPDSAEYAAALEMAKAQMPLLCPAPTVVMVP